MRNRNRRVPQNLLPDSFPTKIRHDTIIGPNDRNGTMIFKDFPYDHNQRRRLYSMAKPTNPGPSPRPDKRNDPPPSRPGKDNQPPPRPPWKPGK